ncbi:MAG TPA: SMC-Scp complex subunit ScpB [Planctomycetota bacterium]|nr:SMC-Scp complex subunit ScpB [Planctomycetota bacterium]
MSDETIKLKTSDAAAKPLKSLAALAPANAENAIGSLEVGDESAGGDPNSPADAALESALEREQNLASAIVSVNVNPNDAGSDPSRSGEYPGERDPLAEPSPPSPLSAEIAAKDTQKELERTVEALLFAASEPISVRELARAADSDSPTIRKVLAALKQTGDRERRPWDLVEVANAWRLVTRPEFHPAIQRLKSQTSQRKLTQAALETLALIAYRQPIGRAEIESVRGVNAGPVLRLLLEKKLIQIAGRGSGVGQPLLYGTTDYFLENFGLKNVSELPKPGEFKNT